MLEGTCCCAVETFGNGWLMLLKAGFWAAWLGAPIVELALWTGWTFAAFGVGGWVWAPEFKLTGGWFGNNGLSWVLTGCGWTTLICCILLGAPAWNCLVGWLAYWVCGAGNWFLFCCAFSCLMCTCCGWSWGCWCWIGCIGIFETVGEGTCCCKEAGGGGECWGKAGVPALELAAEFSTEGDILRGALILPFVTLKVAAFNATVKILVNCWGFVSIKVANGSDVIPLVLAACVTWAIVIAMAWVKIAEMVGLSTNVFKSLDKTTNCCCKCAKAFFVSAVRPVGGGFGEGCGGNDNGLEAWGVIPRLAANWAWILGVLFWYGDGVGCVALLYCGTNCCGGSCCWCWNWGWTWGEGWCCCCCGWNWGCLLGCTGAWFCNWDNAWGGGGSCDEWGCGVNLGWVGVRMAWGWGWCSCWVWWIVDCCGWGCCGFCICWFVWGFWAGVDGGFVFCNVIWLNFCCWVIAGDWRGILWAAGFVDNPCVGGIWPTFCCCCCCCCCCNGDCCCWSWGWEAWFICICFCCSNLCCWSFCCCNCCCSNFNAAALALAAAAAACFFFALSFSAQYSSSNPHNQPLPSFETFLNALFSDKLWRTELCQPSGQYL